ncbi:hypothetical protein [Pelagibaculum spongiae]|uniref:Uncharacterized protein n=1 Tax=Pelagibaculum spongiae TaxID=2080658 RepID=A0A2V1GW75_9GAMM|nr:hypothetical protein [Pelagibaculum spongiae]PVZ70270.1 hypothetical protein DC094_06640 [Pelagibaculum spongiae]
MPTGWYDFVIKKELPSVIFLTEQTQSGTIGHSTVAKFKSVHFAGELFFAPEAGYRDDEGKYFRYGDLVLWTNKSGHYQVGAKFGHSSRAKDKVFELVEKQTALAMLGGIRLLPMDSFFQWDGDI